MPPSAEPLTSVWTTPSTPFGCSPEDVSLDACVDVSAPAPLPPAPLPPAPSAARTVAARTVATGAVRGRSVLLGERGRGGSVGPRGTQLTCRALREGRTATGSPAAGSTATGSPAAGSTATGSPAAGSTATGSPAALVGALGAGSITVMGRMITSRARDVLLVLVGRRNVRRGCLAGHYDNREQDQNRADGQS